MNDYEDAVIRRIDARRAVASLSDREQTVLRLRCRYGHSLRETGEAIGVTPERLRQIEIRAERHAAAFHRRKRIFVDIPPAQRQPPPKVWAFETAEFLEHMRGLMRRRESMEFSRDYATIQGMLESERSHKAPPPPPPPYWVPPPPPKPDFCGWQEARMVASEALHLLMEMLKPAEPGSAWMGRQVAGCRFHWRDGKVREAMKYIVDQLPSGARLSACPSSTGIANSYLAVNAAPSVGGIYMNVDITWDAPKAPATP